MPRSDRPDETASASPADGSPLDVMLTDAAIGPIRRLFANAAGLKLAARLAGRPIATTQAQLKVVREMLLITLGRSKVGPSSRDKRFADPAWTGNPLLHRLLQAYLVLGGAVEDLIDEADLDYRSEQQVRWIAQIIIDAVAPSNNPLLNPSALKAALDSGGRNYLTGLKHFAQDMSRRPRIPAMVDRTPFQVGGNIAVTEGAVVLRTEIFELLQYRPRTETVHEVPLLLVPPMINKYYVADLAPGRSMIEHLVDNGHQVFTMSWRNPKAEHRQWDLESYVGSVIEAMDAVQDIADADAVNVMGICAGGITSSVAIAHLAAAGQLDRVNTLTLGVTLLDQNRAGTVGAIVDENTAKMAIGESQRRGYLDGKALSGVFAWLRPNDLVWNYWVNNYLLGKKPPAFDVLFWNADSTRMPAGLHRDFIRMSVKNALTKPGSLTVKKTPIDLGRITCDAYVVAGQTDHICPWEACYRSAKLLGSKPRFVLSTAGHIAALVNPPTNKKASFRVNDALPDSGGLWEAGAVTHPGSWWTDHADWLSTRSGERKPAPTELGSAKHPVIDRAPGTYVLET